ncbi:hypothetical protein Tco_0558974 [Tanacetum coccineum]
MAEVQTTAEINIFATGQQHTEQPEFNNEGKVDQNAEQCHDIQNEQLHKENEHLKQTYKDLFDSIKRTRVQTKDQNDSLMAQLNKKSNENADVLAQIQKKGFAIAALKNELRKLLGNMRFQQERHSPLALTKLKVNAPNGSKQISLHQMASEQALNVKYSTLIKVQNSRKFKTIAMTDKFKAGSKELFH